MCLGLCCGALTHGAPPARAEDVDAGAVGSLPRETIRRVIRANIESVRHCYEQGLATEPNLAGRVVVSFIIGTDGRFLTAGLASSSMAPAGPAATAVETCVQSAVSHFRFPPPEGGGAVLVNYPFVLDTND